MDTQQGNGHPYDDEKKSILALEQTQTLIAVGMQNGESIFLNFLRNLGYVIEKYSTIEGLREQIIYQIPNVLLLDVDTLQEDAIKLTELLKFNPITYTMPIIIIIGKRDVDTEIRCLEAGAEDFITKPIIPELLASRIRNCTRRNIRLQISNPLTGLPGTTYVEEQTTIRLDNNIPTAMCYVDIVEFKAFNDKYGYNRGDVVIKLLANILNEVVGAYCEPGDFVGHIGGDDFVIIIQPNNIDEACRYILESFDTLIPFQYDEEDMKKGCIVSKNRQGEETQFPIMTVTIGVVTNANRQLDSYLIMTELAAEMKNYCKAIIKSSKKRSSLYRVDQRSN